MGKLEEICSNPRRFGCVMIVPDTRPGAIWGPFKVTESRLDPAKRFGSIRFSRRPEDGWKFSAADLQRGDCLLHLPSGATASVVAREGLDRALIEGWTEPDPGPPTEAWIRAPGLGDWVVWGTCFRSWSELPPYIRPPEVIPSEEVERARREMSRFPDRLPWSKAGFAVAKDPRTLKGKAKKQLRRRLRKLLGGMHAVEKISDLDALIERSAVSVKKAAAGGEFVHWRIEPKPPEQQ